MNTLLRRRLRVARRTLRGPPLCPAHARGFELRHPGAAEAHRAARDHLLCRRPSCARGVPHRADRGSGPTRARGTRARPRFSTAPRRATCPLRELARTAHGPLRHQGDPGPRPHHLGRTAGPRPHRQAAHQSRATSSSPRSRRSWERSRPSPPTRLATSPSPIDDDGMRVDDLEEALRAGPKFLYVLPNFQNPSGTTLSLARRNAWSSWPAATARPSWRTTLTASSATRASTCPRWSRSTPNTMAAPTASAPSGAACCTSARLSKVLAPGLRLGWVVAPEEVIAKLVQLKQGTDLHTSTFTQMVAYEAARGGFIDQHVPSSAGLPTSAATPCSARLERHFPPGVRWTKPQGGLFLWVTLPSGLDSARLLEEALEKKVAFVPGAPFFPWGVGQRPSASTSRTARPSASKRACAGSGSCWPGPRVDMRLASSPRVGFAPEAGRI